MDLDLLLDSIGEIDDAYILSAQKRLGYLASGRRAQTRRPLRRAVCLLAAVLLLFAALTTAMAVDEGFRESVLSVMEALFPPKDIPVALEGTGEDIPHSAQGREPEESSPGFAVYVDPARYTMTVENEISYIRPITEPISRDSVRRDNSGLLEGLTPEEQEAVIDRLIEELEAFYASLPPCEMEIQELRDSPEAAAETVREQMANAWETISEVSRDDQPPRLYFTVSGGSSWDSPQEEHYFCSNGQQGAFHITLRYFLEAAEGHGGRFHAMLDTFTVVAPQDAAQPDTAE